MLDPVNEWFNARITKTESEPHEGWPSTGKLFSDFKEWAIEQGHVERFLPPVNTFSQRLKAFPGVHIKRLSRGSMTPIRRWGMVMVVMRSPPRFWHWRALSREPGAD